MFSGGGGKLIASNQRRLFIVRMTLTKCVTVMDGGQVTGITVHPGVIDAAWVSVQASGYKEVTSRDLAKKSEVGNALAEAGKVRQETAMKP